MLLLFGKKHSYWKMRLEDQVCSLDLAKRLKELGCRQESAFYWVTEHNEPFDKGWVLMLSEDILERGFIARQKISAFLVSELGEMLPNYFGSISRSEDWFCGNFSGNRWHPNDEESQRAGTEANARAAMLVYLIETGVIKP